VQELRTQRKFHCRHFGVLSNLPAFFIANSPGMLRALQESMQKSRDLRVRSFRFAVDVVQFSRTHLVHDAVIRRLAYQLVDSAGSVGANLEESGGGQTKPDFITKQFVALKEIREANFWLRVIAETYPDVRGKLAPLLQESGELKAMITASVLTAKSNPQRGSPDRE
jgi:four helix bundle protein